MLQEKGEINLKGFTSLSGPTNLLVRKSITVTEIHPTNGVLHSQGNQILRIGLPTNGWRAYVRTYGDHVPENLWRFYLRFFLSTILPFLVNAYPFHSNLLFAYSFLSMYTMYTGKPEGKRPLLKNLGLGGRIILKYI